MIQVAALAHSVPLPPVALPQEPRLFNEWVFITSVMKGEYPIIGHRVSLIYLYSKDQVTLIYKHM